MAIYPNPSNPTQESASASSPDKANLTAAVQAVRSHLTQDGLLSNPELQQHWQQIEQLANDSTAEVAQGSFKSERQRLLAIASQMRACTSREALLQTTTAQVQQALRADRVLIYRFTGSSGGTVVAESMAPGYTPTLKQSIPAPCFGAATAADYQRQPILPVPDVRQAGFSPHTLQILERYQVRSSCCAAIYIEGQIWGLLAAHSTDRPRPWQEAEVNLLYQIATELTSQLQPFKFRYQLQQQAQQEQVFNKIVEDVRQETSETDKLFLSTCQEVRRLLRADRSIVYRFNLDWTGEVVAESVGQGWVSLLVEQDRDEVLRGDRSGNERSILKAWSKGTIIEKDTYLLETKGGIYSRGKKFTCVNDVYSAGFSPCYIETLEKYQVRAYIIVPIFYEERLWGLLGVYHNSGPRKWQESEVQLMVRLSAPLGVALKQTAAKEQMVEQSDKLARDAKLDLAFVKTLERIWQSLDAKSLFQTVTDEVRQLLEVDRAVIYQFNADGRGQFIAESVGTGWMSLMQAQESNPALTENLVNYNGNPKLEEMQEGLYNRGATYTRVDDINKGGLPAADIRQLEQYQAQAYVMIPVFQNDRLWGLMGVYQNAKPREWEQGELNILVQLGKQLEVAVKQAEYVTQLEQQSEQLAETAERDRAVAQTINRIRSSSNLNSIFRTATQELRRLLKADRAVVYKFNPDWSGQVVAESVASGWVSLLAEQEQDSELKSDRTRVENCLLKVWGNNQQVDTDTYLKQTRGGQYAQGQKFARVDDIYEVGFADCYISSLEKYQARAYIIVPIIQGDKLWGLLGIYQNSGPRPWQEGDIDLMTRIADPLGIALQQAEAVSLLSARAQQEQVLSKLLEKIQQAPGLDSIFRTTCQEVRQVLQADRAVVYRFNEDWSGEVVAESVGSGWVSLLTEQEQDAVLTGDRTQSDRCILKKWSSGTIIERDTYLQETQGGRYVRGEKVTRINDIYAAGFPACYIDTLEKYQARAYAIAPIFQEQKLWGLLGVYQNSGPRPWQDDEVDLMVRLSTPLGFALQQAEVLGRLSVQSTQLANTAEREKTAKEQLQQRAVQLLAAIQPSFKGDLTVRAPLTEDEVGTIADAYNNTIQSLRKIVVQVKGAADKVEQTSRQSEGEIVELSQQAQEELTALSEALDRIQSMVNSTEAVASNAQQVELAVQQARDTVQAGDAAMNRTVEGFADIRQTVAETSQKIKRLGESSQKITKVVNLISNFATQTNLLALNAAIEATRAGEYGRGFAVVADEVRSLARQSEDATSEIENLVLEIQQETSAVATAMDSGIQQVVSGTNLVNETRQNLNAIVEATAEIGELVAGITQATQTQTQQSEAVTQTMENVAAIARKTSDGATHIAASFQDLLTTAEELQANVGQFKVES